MAFLFDDANTEYMIVLAATKTSVPLSMACWFSPDDLTVGQCLMSIANNNSDVNYFSLEARGDVAGDHIRAGTRSSVGYVAAISTNGYVANAWHHACGVWASSGDRRVYLDGGNTGTNNFDRTPSGLNRTAVGVLCRQNKFLYTSGLIAEAAIWDVALTDAEAAILAAGYSPLFVRPQNLLVYWPMVRKLGTGQGIELMQGKQLLVGIAPDNGSHCPVRYPAAGQLQRVASGIPLAIIMQHYKKTRVA
ncbi:MAG: LamG domain-containing protein [Planctomycetota bacterium]|jgi:hypothetical protein